MTERDLTDLEKELLAIIWKDQPCTPYWVKRVLESSPVGAKRDSAGSAYPALNRLAALGYLKKKRIRGDKRGASQVTCTRKGLAEIVSWMLEINALETFPSDPLRTRVFFLGALSRNKQKKWIEAACQICKEQLKAIEAFEQLTEPKSDQFAMLGNRVAKASVRSRLKVLNAFRREIDEG